MSPQDQTQPNGVPAHFLVIVPGYMGSKLRDKQTGEIVWMDIPALLRDPFRAGEALNSVLDRMAYPNENLEPAGIVDQVLFLPPWVKQEQYGRLTEALKRLGYRDNPDKGPENKPVAYTFSYDWRQDNRISARQLGEAIERWRERHRPAKAWIIAHSNGGIISRWYIEKEGGQEHVDRLFLMGSPWDGAPKSLSVMMNGFDVFFLRLFNRFDVQDKIKQLIRTFPSFYQLIPHSAPFLCDEHNQPIDLFSDPKWLGEPREQEMLLDGLNFNQELGKTLSVDTVCFFGRRKPTLTSGVVSLGAGGSWSGVEWSRSEAGDGTVPEHSAVNPNARASYAFAVDHGNIYIDPQVLLQLDWELIGRYQLATRAALFTDVMNILFEPEQDVYEPGEPIPVWAEITENAPGTPPFSGASIRVRMIWKESLPGQAGEAPKGRLPTTLMRESPDRPGYYTGSLPAPSTEGYYCLQATVSAVGKPTLMLDELISVEKIPDQVGG